MLIVPTANTSTQGSRRDLRRLAPQVLQREMRNPSVGEGGARHRDGLRYNSYAPKGTAYPGKRDDQETNEEPDDLQDDPDDLRGSRSHAAGNGGPVHVSEHACDILVNGLRSGTNHRLSPAQFRPNLGVIQQATSQPADVANTPLEARNRRAQFASARE